MDIIIYPKKSEWQELYQRPYQNIDSVREVVRSIFSQVELEGDEAIARLTINLDGVCLKETKVTKQEIAEAVSKTPEKLKQAIQQAQGNIERFHKTQTEKVEIIETSPGVSCWRKSVPLQSVGLYIPGGNSPLFSTVLMLGIPALIARCPNIVLCTPPGRDGTVNETILYTAHMLGITDIFKVGGAQAIAAMTFGTETIPKVTKLFGPGNQFVTEAKLLARDYGLSIDLPAGPSEVAVIADGSANPQYIAADLLSQAEHGIDSQCLLITTDLGLTRKVVQAIDEQIAHLETRNIAKKSLENGKIILLKSVKECVDFSNGYAPEHLIINTKNPHELAKQIINAGSVFLGPNSPESAGDYASGTNHTLPTAGYARNYSGLSVDSFVKKITFQQLTEEGLRGISDSIEIMAEAEGLPAHQAAVSIRLTPGVSS